MALNPTGISEDDVGRRCCRGRLHRLYSPERVCRFQSPPLMPEDLVEGRDLWYATLNQSAPGGDGLIVRVMAGRAKKIEGNPDYPINAGKSSAIDQAVVQDLYHPDRIGRPLKRRGDRGSGEFDPISWSQAYGELASKLRGSSGQPDRVCFGYRAPAGTPGVRGGQVCNRIRRPTSRLRPAGSHGRAFGAGENVRSGHATGVLTFGTRTICCRSARIS